MTGLIFSKDHLSFSVENKLKEDYGRLLLCCKTEMMTTRLGQLRTWTEKQADLGVLK